MANQKWIAISDYSIKYKTSISTLRRRMKQSKIDFNFEGGKYWLRDEPPKRLKYVNKTENEAPAASAPPQKDMQLEVEKEKGSTLSTSFVQQKNLNQGGAESSGDSSVWGTAQQLLQEIKKAYMVILQEKEEQILILKDELSDLKTLIRVLEHNNKMLSEQLLEKTSNQNSNISTTSDWAFSLDK